MENNNYKNNRMMKAFSVICLIIFAMLIFMLILATIMRKQDLILATIFSIIFISILLYVLFLFIKRK